VRVATDACGGSRCLARDVEHVHRAPGGIELALTRRLRPDTEHRTTIFIPVGAP
jgi:hypothetical protein